MSFEWDHNKATINLDKHGIDFSDAATVFDDSNAVTIMKKDLSQLEWTHMVAFLL